MLKYFYMKNGIQNGTSDYKVILFYRYVYIQNPDMQMIQQRELCNTLNLKGRMIIAKEGINATLEGTKQNIDEYVNKMNNINLFSGMKYKYSDGTGSSFPKLSIKVRDEIVSLHLGAEDLSPNEVTGKYISPDELQELIDSDTTDAYVIIDMRNDYECYSGYFKGSIKSKMKNFRDLKKYVKQLEKYKNKKVITVCTGGIRCEKASGYLIKKGFKDVNQLEGGIHSYMVKYPNKSFLGKLYVFDSRVLVSLGNDKVVVSKCVSCNKKCEKYINCANTKCHKHFIKCDECIKKEGKACCKVCEEKVQAIRAS